MMSDGCRLALEYAEGGGDAAQRPASLFYKRVVMGDLAAARTKALAAPKKLRRDVRSYAVEAAFLGSRACADLVASGVRLPRAFLVEQRPDEADPEGAIYPDRRLVRGERGKRVERTFFVLQGQQIMASRDSRLLS